MKFDLAKSCGEMPGGADVANGTNVGLVIEIEGVLSFGDGMHWGLRITKPTYSPTGRKRKSVPIILLVANPGQTMPDLLREVARLWEYGEYTTGTPLPLDPAPLVSPEDFALQEIEETAAVFERGEHVKSNEGVRGP
jgi:hypothetical protein